MPFLLAEILNFQGSTHHIGVGSFSYISNFKTVAKQLSNSRELYLRRGIFLCYNQVQDFVWSGNRTDRAFTQFDELGVTEWKQQH